MRLTGEDGYQAQRLLLDRLRARGRRTLALTVERLEDGEVSPYLVDDVRARRPVRAARSDRRLLRLDGEPGGPLLLVAGGSGVVPLMAMLRHRAAVAQHACRRVLLYSSRTFEDVIYREELERLAARGDGLAGRPHAHARAAAGLDRALTADRRAMLAEVGFPAEARPQVFVCGPTGLVESVGQHLLDLGHDPSSIKTERFGPSGG